jgi:hypothetical protein
MIAPREHDLFAAAARAFDRIDPVIGRYGRPGRELEVRIANGLPRRQQVMGMRDRHYRETLADLGVPVWDQYDEDAVQVLCTEGGEPVGSLRLTENTPGDGDLSDDFDDVRAVLGAGPFAVVGRALVVPERRSCGVLRAVVHAACRWLDLAGRSRIVVTCLLGTLPAVLSFGGKTLTEPLRLGPRQIPVVLVELDAATAVEFGADWFRAHGWSVG